MAEEALAEETTETTESTAEEQETSQSETTNLWPDNWRESIAGEDEKELKHLGRYATPADVWKKARALEQRISSGDFKSTAPFPEKGTDEEKAAWRADNGIPESVDKYDIGLEGVPEEDKEIIDSLAETAFEKNLSPEAAKTAAEWYYSVQEKMAEAELQADTELKAQAEDELRAEWGAEYRANVNRIGGLLDTAPEGVKDKFMNARLNDGTPLASDPDSLKFLIDLALQINPATTLVPGAGDNLSGAISDEIASIEKMMGNKRSDYWKGPKSEGLQQRYRELISARDKMK